MKSYTLQQRTLGTATLQKEREGDRERVSKRDRQICFVRDFPLSGSAKKPYPTTFTLSDTVKREREGERKKLQKACEGFWRNLVDVSAGIAANPTEPWRPFTSWPLTGHATLDE